MKNEVDYVELKRLATIDLRIINLCTLCSLVCSSLLYLLFIAYIDFSNIANTILYYLIYIFSVLSIVILWLIIYRQYMRHTVIKNKLKNPGEDTIQTNKRGEGEGRVIVLVINVVCVLATITLLVFDYNILNFSIEQYMFLSYICAALYYSFGYFNQADEMETKRRMITSIVMTTPYLLFFSITFFLNKLSAIIILEYALVALITRVFYHTNIKKIIININDKI